MPLDRRPRVVLAATALLVGAGVAGVGAPVAAAPVRAAAVPLYPPVGAGTALFDHGAKVAGFVEPEWYEANIPFVDLPDAEVEDTYYYRWRTYKEALKYTGPEDGWIVSEFLGPVGYSAPGGGIVAAAGHHVYEGRWLRDTRYLDDYLDYWLRGSGAGPKPATDFLNEHTTDWAHQYSFWAADAVVARARVDGRWDFAVDRLPELERQWAAWAPQFDRELGLYWQVPVWDAMEYTASAYQSDDPYHGGDGFRPTINAYQFGDAVAIAELLRSRGRAGDRQAADRYQEAARSLQSAVDRHLWSAEKQFYQHVMREDRAVVPDREQIGFVPWYFHMAPPGAAPAWAQLTDPMGFAARFGPTTVERRSPWYLHDALVGCCRWSGPSWPYATSQALTAMANLLTDYPAQPYVDRQDYYDVLRGYALTQRKDGRPYVAEAHHPDEDRWIYDGRGHSEDYNHSTFNDLVLSGLLGIRPRSGDEVRISPLVPAGWDRFAVENAPYHGRNLTAAWDRDGDAYGRGAGLRVWVDGQLVHHQDDLAPVDVPVGPARRAGAERLVDDLANGPGTGYPAASASHTWHADSLADAIDGQDFHLDVPSTRWTSYGSPNRQDWLAVDLGAPTRVSDVRISFYDDGGGVRTPDAYDLQYRTPAGGWADVPGQARTPRAPEHGRLNRVLVDPAVVTDGLRVRPLRADGGAVGVTALQSWRAEDLRVTARLRADDDGVLRVRPGGVTEVVAEVLATGPVTARPALFVPAGWRADPVGPAGDRAVTPGRPLEQRWRLHVPDDVVLGERAPLRLMVSTDAGHTADLVRAEAVFDPADFTTPVWDDGFDGPLDAYRVDGRFGEPVPDLRTEGGALVVEAGRQSAAVLAAPVTAPPGDLAVVLEPRSFAGTAPEDSVLLGRADGSDDLVMAWYNNHFRTSAVDVRVDGRDRGDATGGCCASAAWSPGDRFAVVFAGGVMTSWVEHGGRWRGLRSAPFGAAVEPGRVEGWSPAIGVRSTGGRLELERVTALGRPG